MKTSKIIWIIVVSIIILGVIAYFVMQANKKKTAAALSTAPNANPVVTGRVVASTGVNLYSRWNQVPNLSTGACPEGSTSGKDLGEAPISTNNGNPVYRCYVSSSNQG